LEILSSFQMRVAISLQLSPEDIQQLLAWYKARDTLLGRNNLLQDVKKALELAAVCKHPDAVWLTKLFAGRDVVTSVQARQVFLDCDDPRALSLASQVHGCDFVLLRRSAELGFAFAQARTAVVSEGEDFFVWAEKSAAQGEREGFFSLGHAWKKGKGRPKNLEKAKECFFIAAELGCVFSANNLGLLMSATDPRRFLWLGRAAEGGWTSDFFAEMQKQFNLARRRPKVIFSIGRALKGQLNEEKRKVFGCGDATLFGNATRAFDFYYFQLFSYRRAVDCWTVVGLKNGVVKDIRKMIAKMIWEARHEAEYEE
jgi:hypothetical protein